jgi:hypothetical protein
MYEIDSIKVGIRDLLPCCYWPLVYHEDCPHNVCGMTAQAGHPQNDHRFDLAEVLMVKSQLVFGWHVTMRSSMTRLGKRRDFPGDYVLDQKPGPKMDDPDHSRHITNFSSGFPDMGRKNGKSPRH